MANSEPSCRVSAPKAPGRSANTLSDPIDLPVTNSWKPMMLRTGVLASASARNFGQRVSVSRSATWMVLCCHADDRHGPSPCLRWMSSSSTAHGCVAEGVSTSYRPEVTVTFA